MTPTGPDERYAEGQREAADCRKCGQPIWIVYHGPSANHTVEPRPAPSLTAHEAECCRTALRAYYGHRERGTRRQAPCRSVCGGGGTVRVVDVARAPVVRVFDTWRTG
jgi:hypothetical protein